MAGREQYQDDGDSSLWTSPLKSDAPNKQSNAAKSPYDAHERDHELEQELQNVRQVNEAIEGVIQSLREAKDKMKVGFRSDHQHTSHVKIDWYRLSTILSLQHRHY
jgi:heme-binding NEAT domain protein